MPLPAGIVKPFAAAWRARIYVCIGFVFWVLHTTIPVPFASIDPAQKEWWQDLISKSFGSFDKVSYFFFLAGLVYAVASDLLEYIWSNSIKSEVHSGFIVTGKILTDSLKNFSTGLSNMSYESVKVWIEGGNGNSEQIRSIFQSALVNHYGQHNLAKDSLTNFVAEDLLDIWAHSNCQTWENFSSIVTIRPSRIPDHFEWEEARKYSVICLARSGKLPLRLEGSVKVEQENVVAVLDSWEFQVRFGYETVVNFKEWWQKHRVDSVTNGYKLETEGIVIEYNGSWLRYAVMKEAAIIQEKTDVSIYEKSHISTEDRCYSLAIRHPTKTLRASLSLEGLGNWAVKNPFVSARLYDKYERAVQSESFHERSCSVTVPGWSLPGVAVNIEWTPSATH